MSEFMRRAIATTAAAGLFLFGVLAVARSQGPAAASLEGVYLNVEEDGGRATIARKTDEGLRDARRVVRSMARPRILESNPPVRRLVIEIDGGEARVTYEGERSYHAPIGGPAVEQRAPDGSKVNVRYELDGSTLVEIAEASRGSGVIRYSRRGDDLVVQTVIEARQLPEPIRFTLRFAPER